MGALTEAVVWGYGKQSCFRDRSEVELKGSGNLHCEDFDTSNFYMCWYGKGVSNCKTPDIICFFCTRCINKHHCFLKHTDIIILIKHTIYYLLFKTVVQKS